MLEGRRRTVLHFSTDTLLGVEVAEVAQVSQSGRYREQTGLSDGAIGPQNWATNEAGAPEVAHESGPMDEKPTNKRGTNGPHGPHPESYNSDAGQQLLRYGARLGWRELWFMPSHSIGAGEAGGASSEGRQGNCSRRL
jgi:hypothetical protein